MQSIFSVHNLYNIRLNEPNRRIRDFIYRQYQYFNIAHSKNINLDIFFVDYIKIPPKKVYLKKDLIYADGNLYFLLKRGKIRFPVMDIMHENMAVEIEKSSGKWHVLYVIEAMVQLKLLEKGFCFFHASGIEKGGRAKIFFASHGGGKTTTVLREIAKGANFLGDSRIMAHSSGFAFSYPRMLSIHEHHGDTYKNILRKQPLPVRAFALFRKIILSIGKAVFWFSPYLKNRLENSIKFRNILYLNIKDIYKDVKIKDKVPMDKMFLLYAGNSCALACKRNIIHSIFRDIWHEKGRHISKYFEAFLAYPSYESLKIKRYINTLLKKEIGIISSIVKKYEFQHMSNDREGL